MSENKTVLAEAGVSGLRGAVEAQAHVWESAGADVSLAAAEVLHALLAAHPAPEGATFDLTEGERALLADAMEPQPTLLDAVVRRVVFAVERIKADALAARQPATVDAEPDCPRCSHGIDRHGPDGCEAYVPPRIGGSGICCALTPADLRTSAVVPAPEGETRCVGSSVTGPMPWPAKCDHTRATCEEVGCPNARIPEGETETSEPEGDYRPQEVEGGTVQRIQYVGDGDPWVGLCAQEDYSTGKRGSRRDAAAALRDHYRAKHIEPEGGR